MRIETRFDINDEIYYLSQDGIKQGKLIGMNINCDPSAMLTSGEVFESSVKINYKTDNGTIIKENNCYASKEELLEHLNKQTL